MRRSPLWDWFFAVCELAGLVMLAIPLLMGV